eukprot:5885109-Amphidinium_carterae.1
MVYGDCLLCKNCTDCQPMSKCTWKAKSGDRRLNLVFVTQVIQPELALPCLSLKHVNRWTLKSSKAKWPTRWSGHLFGMEEEILSDVSFVSLLE